MDEITLAEYDEDDDMIYTRIIYEKKQRLKLPHSDEDIHVIDQNVTPRHPVDEMPSMDNIISTFYQTLPVSAGFLCDECMAGDHLHSVVEECRVCRAVGEIISLRRQA